ncbi:Tubulin--tyrosine ligase-like protein 12 [Xenoophorus captivus]|uniref:Tubulin--tyrosine ligase-like protein 12 n=1 Tax=Xenoophorus captivus TaxID=1517983 RepID=A0ABV0QQT4_9TELE
MGVDFHGEVPTPDIVELILERMWNYNQTYQLSQGSAEEKVPVWYIMDEFGSQVQHSDHPSCCMAPFFYIQGQLAYTLLWPLRDLQEGDEVTHDYAYGETNTLLRRCRLLPWINDDLEGVSSDITEPTDSYYEVCVNTMARRKRISYDCRSSIGKWQYEDHQRNARKTRASSQTEWDSVDYKSHDSSPHLCIAEHFCVQNVLV